MTTRRRFAKFLAAAPLLASAPMRVTASLLSTGQAGGSNDMPPTLPAWKNHIDPDWVKPTLVEGLLDHWVKASVAPNGFIQENLGRKWEPIGTQREATVNGQGRQLYCYAVGYELTRRKEYLDAIHKCTEFLLKMRDSKFGGFFNRTSPDLKVIDDRKTGYTSFAVFSLAHVARITGESAYREAALAAWEEAGRKLRDGYSYHFSMSRDFSTVAALNVAGPTSKAAGQPPNSALFDPRNHMLNLHMFEALLAVYDLTKETAIWDQIATQLNGFAQLYDQKLGYLPEIYHEDWKPVDASTYNVGHLFEWASLFSRAVELGADPKFIPMGSRSIDLALKVGLDPATGGVWMNAKADGGPARKYMIWWTQCETMKVCARYAILHNRPELWPIFDRNLEFVRTNFFDREYGGWFEGVVPGEPREALGERAFIKGAVDGPEWGSYHQTSCFTDLLHLTSA